MAVESGAHSCGAPLWVFQAPLDNSRKICCISDISTHYSNHPSTTNALLVLVELVNEFVEQCERHTGRVLLVRDDDASEAVATHKDVTEVLCGVAASSKSPLERPLSYVCSKQSAPTHPRAGRTGARRALCA